MNPNTARAWAARLRLRIAADMMLAEELERYAEGQALLAAVEQRMEMAAAVEWCGPSVRLVEEA